MHTATTTCSCTSCFQSLLTVSELKIDCNTGRTRDWTARGFVTCLARLSIILGYYWFRFVHKRLFKDLFKCKSEKSDDKVHQSQLLKPRPLSVQLAWLYYAGLLCCDPCVSLKPRTVTRFKLTALPLQQPSIHVMNTIWKRTEWQLQWCMKWTILLTFCE